MLELKAHFSHFIVDGVVVNDTPLDYVKQNRKDTKEVEVIFVVEDRKPPKKKAPRTLSHAKTGPIRVKISNNVFEVKRTLPGVKEMFDKIDEYMKDFELYFSHLVADGAVVDGPPLEYVEQNLKKMNELEVIFLTAEQYLLQVAQVMKSFLERALPTFKTLADDFYAKPDDGTWEQFSLAMQGLGNMVDLVNSLFSNPAFNNQSKVFADLGKNIGNELANLKEAAEHDDMTLIGDILHYELVPFVESLHTAVEKLSVSHEVQTH
jgi:predicted acylesterase/phospholipase RssA